MGWLAEDIRQPGLGRRRLRGLEEINPHRHFIAYAAGHATAGGPPLSIAGARGAILED